MTKYKFLFFCLTILLASNVLNAQTNGSNSSYSRFGLGTLNEQSQGFNKGMGGIGLGIRGGSRLNMQNPASYSAIDSITLLMDAGFNASFGRMKNGGNSANVTNCSIDYVNAGFHLARHLGLSVGFVPYSTIGYNFSTEGKVGNEFTTAQTIKSQNTYRGDGGLHQVYLGAGWATVHDISIGANISYMWGAYSHDLTQTFTEGGSSAASYSGLSSTHEASLRTYKIDLGIQYPFTVNKHDKVTVGVVAGLGHNMKNDATLTRYTSTGDSLHILAKNAFDLPYSFGGGVSWEHNAKWLIGADFKQELWSNCKTPVMHSGTAPTYIAEKGAYKNRTKIAIGGQYVPDMTAKSYAKRMIYRVGTNYSTPYLKINGQDGPSEYMLTAGVGLPTPLNSSSKGTLVNVNVQWLHRAAHATNMITENYFILNLGVTINERWFQQFKIQ